MNNPLNNPEIQKGLFYLVVGVGVAWFIKNKLETGGAAATEFVTQTINPVSNKNAVYQSVNKIAGVDSLGSTLYDWFGDDYENEEEPAWYEGWFDGQETPAPVKNTNTVEDQNFIYKTANNLVGVDSIGSSIYDAKESLVNWYNDL